MYKLVLFSLALLVVAALVEGSPRAGIKKIHMIPHLLHRLKKTVMNQDAILDIICVYSLPITIDELVGVFANPVKDFMQLVHPSKSVITTTQRSVVTLNSMIDVPFNDPEPCENGTVRDIYGVCRRPWRYRSSYSLIAMKNCVLYVFCKKKKSKMHPAIAKGDRI
ncbi:unnamed protein product [Leptosia nina]|uniref:Uncharacterized protein n=1 Tax=Leptosia nina TaxID=320188 RepID=A0AAV1JR95_9NEOP